MGNHYNLLIETPAANASRALQWLNLNHSMWFKTRHGHAGPVFQARFKSIPVEGEGSWALARGAYVHLNPVRVKVLGQGRDYIRRERAGLLPEQPTREQVRARMAKLRGYRWRSYRAYAGYASAPEWLTCATLWERCCPAGKHPKTEYRRYLEDYLRRGVAEGVFERLTAALAIGGTSFVEGLRRKVPRKAGPETNAMSNYYPFVCVRIVHNME